MNVVAVVFLLFTYLSSLFQSEIGFGKLQTYSKLEKLGEVSVRSSICTLSATEMCVSSNTGSAK